MHAGCVWTEITRVKIDMQALSGGVAHKYYFLWTADQLIQHGGSFRHIAAVARKLCGRYTVTSKVDNRFY